MTLKQLAARILIESVALSYIRVGRYFGMTGERTARFAIETGAAEMIAEIVMPGPWSILAEIAVENILTEIITREMAPYVDFVVIEIIAIEGPTE